MKKMMKLLICFILFFPVVLQAQDLAIISGKVTDSDNKPVFLANVTIPGTRYGTVTRENGEYELTIPADTEVTLVFSCVGFKQIEEKLLLNPGEHMIINKMLEIEIRSLEEVSISEEADRTTTITRIDTRTLDHLPSVSGSVEAIIATLPGVVSTSELSSQYSVRGGNFDENLVYVNDIEIHRPFLIRSGQQEGMSFINSDMVSSIRFSAGGFEAMYGDKMSSVLDIQYRRPSAFGGSTSLSLLGGSLQLEGTSKNQRFTYNSGFRYKTTKYLLQSFETKGEYMPNFLDFQTLLSYELTKKLEISFLGNVANNQYQFIPESRNTEFGTYKNPLNLKIYYDGQEMDRFNTYLGAFTTHLRPNDNLSLKLIASAFSSIEEEKFDIQGQYWLNELDNRLGSDTYGDSILNIGIGTFLNHARNNLDAFVYSLSHIGYLKFNNNTLKWGIQWQQERINDKISEWEMIDSSGYSIPYSDAKVNLFNVIKSKNFILSSRFSAYIQNTFGFAGTTSDYYLNAGIRFSYWDLNNQLLASPRLTFSIKPEWDRNIMLRFSAGLYYQPPFYKELRYPDGSINREILAQQSIHFVSGGDYIFNLWDRPFKFTTEIYYKRLQSLIPYKLDNVRIQYAAENKASGYACGIDMKLFGEFVPGAESWISIGIMKTEEDINGDFYYNELLQKKYIGAYPRPTDQRFNLGLFFQDYLPDNPDYKVHLNVLYGTGLPFSPPNNERYDMVFRMPSYKRVDIGFSRIIKSQGQVFADKNPLNLLKDAWISFEIFNLLGINNTISYLWVRTVENQEGLEGQFAVPNFLTSRRFNLKLTAKF